MPPRAALLAAAALAVAPVAAGNGILVLWPDGAGHSHSDASQHAGLGFGGQLLGYLNLGESIGEVDLATDPLTGKTWAAVALLRGGFALVDASDPAKPVLVSKTITRGYGADVKLSDDAGTVLMSLQGFGGSACTLFAGDVVPPRPSRGTCGLQVWDASDKAEPRFLWTLPSSSGGSHMLDFEVLHGVATLAMAAQGTPQSVPFAVLLGDRTPMTVGRADTGFVHDVTLRLDPLEPSRSLAFVANWDSGVRVYDITDPSRPALLGHWVPPPGSGGRIHTVMPMALEGRRIVVAEQENFGQDVVSKLFFLDATDLGNIVLLGTWQNPDGKMANEGFVRWSTHNFNIVDGKLYLAHYHGGVLVLDVSSLAKLAAPPILANVLPAMPPVAGAFGSDVPLTWDAVPHGGVVWATDINTGLYAYSVG